MEEGQDFTELLDSLPEKEPVKDIGELTHQLTMVVFAQALNGNIDAVRMKNRGISPMGLAGELSRTVERLLSAEKCQ